MSIFYLVMVPLSLLGGLWVTFRQRSLDPRGRFLTLIVGLAIAGLALYQGLQGQAPFKSWKAVATPSQPATLSVGARILPHAVAFLLIMVVAMVGVLVFYAAYFALKDHNFGVVRARLRALLRYVIYVGAYFYVAIFPMGLIKRHILILTDQTVYEITVAYVSLIAVLIFVAMVLGFDKEVRRHKAAVIGFYCGLLVVAGSSPFVWSLLATAVPAIQPIGVLSIFAMVAPAPAYFLLHYRLGWL